MSVTFGPVPGSPAPPSVKVAFLVFILGVVFIADIARSHPRPAMQRIIFVLIALTLTGVLLAVRWL